MEKIMKGDLSRKQINHLIYFGICLLIIAVWLFVIAPVICKIPDNFSYQAEILSIDNLYDENSNQFEGEQLSNTHFNYEVIKKLNYYLLIKNNIEVRKQDKQVIFSASRIYAINPLNWKHIKTPEYKREGYLFGPRFWIKKPFLYWHVNYNLPFLMRFIKVTQFHDLKVYRYEGNVLADQSENLNYLSGVPDKRHIISNAKLILWIEPLSGWLVKYQDNTVANYVDNNSKKIVSTWNKFSNRYTQNSIRMQVHNAYQQKMKIILIYFIIPAFLLFIGIMWLLTSIYNFKYYANRLLILLKRNGSHQIHALILSGIIILTVWIGFELQNKKLKIPIIGIAQFNDEYYASAIQGFKDELLLQGYEQDKNVIFKQENAGGDIEKQIRNIENLIRNDINLIFTVTTPATKIAKGIVNKSPIVFAIVTYPVEAGIIASFSNSGNNLVGASDYIHPAEQFYLLEKIYPNIKAIAFVHHKGDPNSQVQYQEVKEMMKTRHIQVIEITGLDSKHILSELLKHVSEFDGLYLACDTLMQDEGGMIASIMAKEYRKPALSCAKRPILEGALAGVISDYYYTGRIAGKKAAAILAGADPKWLNSETAMQKDIILNLEAARVLGITIHSGLLKEADQIIPSTK